MLALLAQNIVASRVYSLAKIHEVIVALVVLPPEAEGKRRKNDDLATKT